jgi:RNA-binding protein 5/10
MPFPPGVGGGRTVGDVNLDTFEVITADKAIDEKNVGNRMLRNMGWQEGLVSIPSLCITRVSIFIMISYCYWRCLVES